MTCSKCGSSNPSDLEICNKCGAPLVDIDEETLRVETMVRAGTTLLVFIVMVRYADMARSEPVLECFERSIRFPAPPNR